MITIWLFKALVLTSMTAKVSVLCEYVALHVNEGIVDVGKVK